MDKVVRVCPLVQNWAYRFFTGFVIKSKRLSPERMNQEALITLRESGMIYVTGEMFSRTRSDRLFCFEHNTGIGKTQWITREFIPYLRRQNQAVAFINIETFFPVGRIMREECEQKEIEDCFYRVLETISSAGQACEYLVLDECDLLFPSKEKPVQKNVNKTLYFDPYFSSYQKKAWEIIRGLKSQGKKIILISWLHPQDISLATSYLGDRNFLMVFDAPVFEIEALPLDDQFKGL